MTSNETINYLDGVILQEIIPISKRKSGIFSKYLNDYPYKYSMVRNSIHLDFKQDVILRVAYVL